MWTNVGLLCIPSFVVNVEPWLSAGVNQWVGAPGCGARCQGFESPVHLPGEEWDKSPTTCVGDRVTWPTTYVDVGNFPVLEWHQRRDWKTISEHCILRKTRSTTTETTWWHTFMMVVVVVVMMMTASWICVFMTQIDPNWLCESSDAFE